MLENYSIDENGVIFQVERTSIIYDQGYVKTRYVGKAPVIEMSLTRLGFLIGSIGRTPKSLLDVGYGAGDFLKTAKKFIPEVKGYDVPPAYPVEDVDVVNNLYERYFEVITFFDSLEHFEDIYEIKDLQCGFVLISVPWCHYINDDWFEAWKHRRPNEHLWHFNLESLKKFMESIGFIYLNHSNIEDVIRKPVDGYPNILSAVFERAK